MKLRLDRRKVGENISVIIFQIVDDQRVGAVVHKLRPLVEKSGVIFICLNDEVSPLSKTGRDTEIGWHAPYEKSGLKTGVIKNPGKHTGSAGLAMGTGDGENPSPIQDLSPQPFGARRIGKPLIQHRLHNRLTAGQSITN